MRGTRSRAERLAQWQCLLHFHPGKTADIPGHQRTPGRTGTSDLGCYANLLLWGGTDLRVNQTYHAMLLLAGAIPAERARRCFDAVARDNHFHFGSATLTPRVCHVGLENDQNVKIWPWWNLWEADARFLFGDTEGALRLIDQAAATLELPDHPGFVKEVLTTEGDLDGGKAFVTAAGNLLATLATGLLGIRHIAPGQLRVAPAFPKQWTQCSASLPTAGGRVVLSLQAGRLRILVEDPSILSVQADATAEVLGAEHRTLSNLWVEPRMEPSRATLPPPLLSRTAVTFHNPGIPHTDFAVFKPWRFQPLAYTHTQRHLLHPDRGERYPCAARLIRDGGGEILLIGASAAAHPRSVDLLSALVLLPLRKSATLSGF